MGDRAGRKGGVGGPRVPRAKRTALFVLFRARLVLLLHVHMHVPTRPVRSCAAENLIFDIYNYFQARPPPKTATRWQRQDGSKDPRRCPRSSACLSHPVAPRAPPFTSRRRLPAPFLHADNKTKHKSTRFIRPHPPASRSGHFKQTSLPHLSHCRATSSPTRTTARPSFLKA